MPRVSYITLQKKYPGMYVLTDRPGGKVIAVNKKLSEAYKEAEKKGYENAAVQHIPPKGLVIYEAHFSLRK